MFGNYNIAWLKNPKYRNLDYQVGEKCWKLLMCQKNYVITMRTDRRRCLQKDRPVFHVSVNVHSNFLLPSGRYCSSSFEQKFYMRILSCKNSISNTSIIAITYLFNCFNFHATIFRIILLDFSMVTFVFDVLSLQRTIFL